MKKKTIRIEAKHINIEERQKSNEIYVRNKIKTAQRRIEQEKRTFDSELQKVKRDIDSEKEKLQATYSDDSTSRDIEMQKLDLKYKEQEHNLQKKHDKSINNWKETADQPIDGDYYKIPATAEQYSVRIEDEIFKIGNWYSIYVNKDGGVSPLHDYGWYMDITNGALNLDIVRRLNPVLDVRKNTEGVEDVKVVYPKIENPEGTELIIFYEDDFS